MNPSKEDLVYINKVANILGETPDRVTWDIPRIELIYRLVEEIEERDKYIQYVTGFPFREVLDNDEESNSRE